MSSGRNPKDRDERGRPEPMVLVQAKLSRVREATGSEEGFGEGQKNRNSSWDLKNKLSLCGMHCQTFCVPTKASPAPRSGVGEEWQMCWLKARPRSDQPCPQEARVSGWRRLNLRRGGEGLLPAEGAE